MHQNRYADSVGYSGAGSEELAPFFCAESAWQRAIVGNSLLNTACVSYNTAMERAIYRIIDANFNRAREAGRLIEEFCRFALNSAALSSRAKQLRHELSAGVGRIDSDLLIASRDADGDVGRAMQVEQQLSRTNIEDCFIAAAKRLTEALRALSETTQTLDPALAETFERLRFQAYTLEKDIATALSGMRKFAGVRLYVIITAPAGYKHSEIVRLAGQCIDGGADCLQLRCKSVPDDRVFQLAGEFVGICGDAGVVSIINDRVDIAVAAGADGVHLGQNDLPVGTARLLEIRPLVIGVSTHTADQLNTAITEGADYVALGPVFATGTKPETLAAGLSYVSEAVGLLGGTSVRSVAIGGITSTNLGQVLEAGARTVAVCSAISEAADPASMCRRLKDEIVAFD